MIASVPLLTAGYNGDDLRAWKQNASGRTYFLYDGANPVVEMDGSGNVTAVNTFGAAGLVSRHTSTGSTFYTFDTQGSTVERLDSSQNVLSTNVWDAFGKPLSGPTSDPWGYEAQDGYFTDTETGLISLSFRYYDPAQGRFLNRDPIGFDGGINLYGYVGNAPTAADDPAGLDGGIGGMIEQPIDYADGQIENFVRSLGDPKLRAPGQVQIGIAGNVVAPLFGAYGDLNLAFSWEGGKYDVGLTGDAGATPIAAGQAAALGLQVQFAPGGLSNSTNHSATGSLFGGDGIVGGFGASYSCDGTSLGVAFKGMLGGGGGVYLGPQWGFSTSLRQSLGEIGNWWSNMLSSPGIPDPYRAG